MQHVPTINKNLISGLVLCKDGFKIILESNKFVVSKHGQSSYRRRPGSFPPIGGKNWRESGRVRRAAGSRANALTRAPRPRPRDRQREPHAPPVGSWPAGEMPVRLLVEATDG